MTPYMLITITSTSTSGNVDFKWAVGVTQDVTLSGVVYKADNPVLFVSPPVTKDAADETPSSIRLATPWHTNRNELIEATVVLYDADDSTYKKIIINGMVTNQQRVNDETTLFIGNAAELDSVKLHTTTPDNQVGSGNSYAQVADPEFFKKPQKWGRS